MATVTYNRFRFKLATAALDWRTSASLYITLVSNSYTMAASHNFASAISGHELSSSSFTGGFNGTIRKSLVNTTVTQNDTDNQAELDADDVVWSGISAGVAYALVILKQSGTNALSELVAYIDSGGFPVTTNGGDLAVSFLASGLVTLISG